MEMALAFRAGQFSQVHDPYLSFIAAVPLLQAAEQVVQHLAVIIGDDVLISAKGQKFLEHISPGAGFHCAQPFITAQRVQAVVQIASGW